MALRPRKPLRANPETTRAWQDRSKPLTRTTGVKPRNAKRRKTEHARAYGPDEHVEWIAAQPCVVCGHVPCQNAHVRTGGMGRKADAKWIVPLCAVCHPELHRIGPQTFERTYRIDLHDLATITDARWEQYRASFQETAP